MSRDQKPGRSNRIAIAPTRMPAIDATPAVDLPPAIAPLAAQPPRLLLAGLFVAASVAGGIGFALSGRFFQ